MQFYWLIFAQLRSDPLFSASVDKQHKIVSMVFDNNYLCSSVLQLYLR